MPHRAFSILSTLLLAALACNLPAGNPPPTPTPTTAAPEAAGATQLPTREISSSTPTPAPTPTAEVPEPPPPAGPLEVLEANVASGAWTYEEGLVLGLKGLVGEISLSAEFGAMTEIEGTGLVLEAQRFVREGADEAARTELTRLLSILQLDRDRLAPFSQPETASGLRFGRGPGLASPDKALQGDCVDLWVDGFPANTPLLCFIFKEQTLGGHQARVYYPATWAPGAAEFAYAQAAHDALAESWPHFAALGSLGTIDLVFTTLPFTEDVTVLGLVPPSEIVPERCLILIYPNAIQTDSAHPSSTPFGTFKQVVAHELFHCFQGFNFPDKFVDSSWGVHDWWGEATAEYFSNIVYPGVNYEWRWTDGFDSKALNTAVFAMSNENFEFFQYLANRIGNPGVIGLLASLPAGNSLEAQQAALSAFPEIESIYHDFGKAYLDDQVTDTSGAAIPGTLTGCCPTQSVGTNPSQSVGFTAKPFTLALHQLVFLEERIYTTVLSTGLVQGEDSARLVEVELGWLDALPEEVIAGCGVEAYRILLTSTAAAGSTFELFVDVTVEEEIGCDECLIGTWELNKANFEAHMDSLMANPDFGVNFIEGGWRYTYGPTGVFTATFTDFIFNYTIVSDDAFGNPIFTDVELNIDGEGTGKYYVAAPGVLITTAPQNAVAFSQKIWMNGDLIGEDDLAGGGFGFDPVQSSMGEYTCSGNVLSIRSAPLDLPQNTPVDYDRVTNP